MNDFSLTILVTRPHSQATELCAAIQKIGSFPVLFPTITINEIDSSPQLHDCLRHINDYDIAVFVSANSVAKVAPYLTKAPHLQIIAIGPGTLQALLQYPLLEAHRREHVILTPKQDYSSEGLLDLPELKNVAGKRIALFCGEGGRLFLAEQLQLRGALVDRIAVYRRSLPNVHIDDHLNDWQQQGLNFIISTSCESLQNLGTMVQKTKAAWFYRLPVLVTSKRMIEKLAKLGFSQPPVMAANATTKAIMSTLQDYCYGQTESISSFD